MGGVQVRGGDVHEDGGWQVPPGEGCQQTNPTNVHRRRRRVQRRLRLGTHQRALNSRRYS